jgi:hypothetical protein
METLAPVTIEKCTYIFNLENTSNITSFEDMGSFKLAVTNFIDTHNLYSFVYPEVYEFFVVQRMCLAYSYNGTSVFETKYKVSQNEILALVKTLRNITKNKTSYFQVINSDI